MDVIALDNHVANVDADPEIEPGIVWNFGVTPIQFCLNGETTVHGIYDAGKLDQNAIAHGVDDSATVGGDLRVSQFVVQGLKTRASQLFVGFHQP
jgi:hypothetical protein